MRLTKSFLGYITSARALDLDLSSSQSIKDAASKVADGLFVNDTSPKGSGGLGLFADEAYWWEAGAVWSGLVDYWSYTGDAKYNDRIA